MLFWSKEQVGWILKNVCFSFTKEEKIEEQKEEDKLLERQKQEDGPINVRCCHLITDTRSANMRAHTHTHTHTHSKQTQTEVCILLCVPTQAPPFLIAAYHVYTSTSATARTHAHTHTHTHTHAWRYNNRECCNRYNEFSHFWVDCVRKCEELNIIQCVTKVNISNMLGSHTHTHVFI